MDIDQTLDSFGVKYIFIESGPAAIKSKWEEFSIDASEAGRYLERYWVELSWGSGDKDQFDFAFNSFGNSVGEAVHNCLNMFKDQIKNGASDCGYYVKAAKHHGIYKSIMDGVI